MRSVAGATSRLLARKRLSGPRQYSPLTLAGLLLAYFRWPESCSPEVYVFYGGLGI